MAELDNLLGSRISLITQQDIRYEGVLFSINQNESSIVLRDVKYYGTEDRAVEKKIAGNDAVLAFVSFPGNEIKDLYVHEGDEDAPAKEEAASKEDTLPPPPPPVLQESKPPPQGPPKEKGGDAPKAQPPRQQQARQQQQQQQQVRQQQQPRQPQQSRQPQDQHQQQQQQRRNNNNRNRGPSTVGTGAHLLNVRERTSNGVSSNSVKAEGEFDFAEGLTAFKKEEVLAEVSSEQTTPVETCYKKDNFFDMLSSSAVHGQAGGGQRERLSYSEERNLNQDTFGAIALQQTNRHRYGGRGRGRGRGRGEGRGGEGRGGGDGYRNRNNNYNNHNNNYRQENAVGSN